MAATRNPSELRLGRYILRRPLGRGGNGQVFLAWQTNATTVPLTCVAKFPLPGHAISAQQCEHLIDEAALVMKLGNHANIVQVLDVDIYKGMPFVVMEYVNGMDLGRLLGHSLRRPKGTLISLTSIYTVLTGMAKGLQHSHYGATSAGKSVGIVHRDIKPGNTLISRDGEVKLSDFGLGRTIDEGTTGEYMRGTYRYMSPEHINSTVTPSMDIYALGVVAWELVENRRFRENYEGTQHISAIMDGEVPPMSNAAVPRELVSLIHGCLDVNGRRRPTARQVLQLLRQCPGYTNDPEELADVLTTVMGSYRASGNTGPSVAATPELAATFAALEALVRGDHTEVVPIKKQRPPPAPPRGLGDPSEFDSRAASSTVNLLGANGERDEDAPIVRRRPIGKSVQPPTEVLSREEMLGRDDARPAERVTETKQVKPLASLPPQPVQSPRLVVPPAVPPPRSQPWPVAPVVAPREERLATEPNVDSSSSQPHLVVGRGVAVEETLPTGDSAPKTERRGTRWRVIPRWLFVGAGLALSVVVVGSAIPMLLGGSDESGVPPGEDQQVVREPAVVGPAADKSPPSPPVAPTPSVATQDQPRNVEAATTVPSPAAEPSPVAPPTAEPEPSEPPPPAQTQPSPDKPAPKRPPKVPRGPATVRFALFLFSEATVRIDGEQLYRVRSARTIELMSGRHRVEWRKVGTEKWFNAGKRRFAPGSYTLLRLDNSGNAEAFKLDPKKAPK